MWIYSLYCYRLMRLQSWIQTVTVPLCLIWTREKTRLLYQSPRLIYSMKRILSLYRAKRYLLNLASCNALFCYKYHGLGVSLNSKMMHRGLVGYPDIMLLCIVHSLHIEALLVCFEATITMRPSGPVIGFIQEMPTPSIRVSTNTPIIDQTHGSILSCPPFSLS